MCNRNIVDIVVKRDLYESKNKTIIFNSNDTS